MKVCFFDIEAGGLKGNVDQVYLCAFLEYGKKPYLISRNLNETSDKRVVTEIRDELEKYDVIIGYNSIRYDKSFINMRLLKHGLRPLKRQLHIDCYRVAKRMLNWTITSKRLICICEHLGIKGKGRVEYNYWELFKYGSVKEKQFALDQIKEHCKQDVLVLQEAYDKCFRHGISSISLA